MTLTDAEGCQSECSETVTVNPLPVCGITGANTFCAGGSTELCASPGAAGYLWSTGAVSSCITVDMAGLYSVTLTDTEGCQSECSETVTVNPLPPCGITGANTFCAGGTTELCASPGAAGYLWSTGAVSSCITVDMPGLYSVTLTDAEGCQSECSETVTVNPLPPCGITGGDIECGEESVEICTPPGALSYLWNTGATTNCITVSLEGTYSVTVTDANGCSSVCSRFVISNTEPPPTITCPSEITIECDESTLPANTGMATAPVYCNIAPAISFADVVELGACPQEFTITRTWTAAYETGNSIICTQLIYVEDSTPPSIVCPPDITIECDESPLPANTGTATATDNCGFSPEVTYSDVFSTGDCDLGDIITRTWQAVDECGNSATCVQVITLLDNAPPLITIVNPLLAANGDTTYAQCYGQDPEWSLPLFDENSVEVNDACSDEVTIDYSQVLVSEGDCTTGDYIVLYRLSWTATDFCGNSSSASVFYALVDRIAPVIYGVPDDITVSCDDIPAMPEQVYATDECLCACLVVAEESVLPSGCLDGEVLLRTWTATDDCGNETVATQRITLVQDQSPEIVVVQAEMAGMVDGMILEYSCSDDGMHDLFDLLGAHSVVGEGMCGDLIPATFNVTVEDGLDCQLQGYVERTYQWTVVDECGNSRSMTIIARLVDNQAPVLIGVPASMACIDDPALQDIHAIDYCGGGYPRLSQMQFSEVEIPNPCGTGTAVERTYEAFDECGNTTSASVVLIRDDLTAPTMTFTSASMNDLEDGEVIEINCAASDGQYTAFSTDDVNVSNACSEGLTVSFAERLISTGDCTAGGVMAVVELSWTATDVCGNTSERVVMAHIVDNSSPAFVNFQPTVAIGCGDAMPTISAIDNCGDVVITTQDSLVLGDCAEFERIVHREITATDACGNTTVRRQVVQVGDGSGPSIIGVEPEVCDDLTIPTVTAYDACVDEMVPVTMVQDTLDASCLESLLIQRTWTAVNACGNETVVYQNILMDNEEPPKITPVASIIDYILDYDQQRLFLSEQWLIEQLDALDEHSVLATDVCGREITPVLAIEMIPGSCEEYGYSERRVYTWEATDVCGNTASFSVSVYIIDDVPPVMQAIPADTTIVCVELPVAPATLLSPFDSASTSYSETIAPENDQGEFLVTRTWVATDSCGNESVATQRITWIPDTDLVCEVLIPSSVVCNSHNVLIGSFVAGGNGAYTYNWEVVGEECFIQGGQGTPDLSIYVGWGEVKITLVVTDAAGCISMCMVVLDCDPSWHSGLMLTAPANPRATATDLAPALALGQGMGAGDYLSELKLWPNPATGMVNLSFESNLTHEVQFTLLNVLGQVVRNEPFTALSGVNTHQMDIGYLAPGRYMIQLKTGQEIHAKPVVIIPDR